MSDFMCHLNYSPSNVVGQLLYCQVTLTLNIPAKKTNPLGSCIAFCTRFVSNQCEISTNLPWIKLQTAWRNVTTPQRYRAYKIIIPVSPMGFLHKYQKLRN
jgi:hypothetical protein